jgi:hypothetical protein
MRQVVARGGTTIAGRATQGGSHWMILRGARLVELFSTRSSGAHPVLSADGRFAAWTTSVDTHRYSEYEAETTFTVTAYDVGAGRVTGTTTVASRTFCCDGGGVVVVAGVDNDGAVVLARYSDQGWLWRAGSDPVPLTGPVRLRGLTGLDQWPGGVSWTTGASSADPAAYARVSARGSTRRLGRVPVSQGGVWSPDGTAYVFQPFSKLSRSPAIVWSHGTRVRLRDAGVGGIVGWESRHSVVLYQRGRHGRPALRPAVLVRCDARTGDCEQAGPAIADAYLPRPPGS